ncbi:hypothetical protein EVA_18751 [gut metagenome]|uniref:Uncharacterized protein n=1 Tax=gut metagenome TaxID=749906 RepID=J9FFE1_9ZZZZ
MLKHMTWFSMALKLAAVPFVFIVVTYKRLYSLQSVCPMKRLLLNLAS